MTSIAYFYCYRFSLLLIQLLLIGLFSPSAYADGGAPQLAYVAGSTSGISIIDIAQQRITRRLAEAGNPHSILLSPDGRTLYITQPTIGQVAMITAKTGKKLCAANLPGHPLLLALNLYATVLYTAGQGDTSIHALNPTNCTVERTFETHQPVYGLAVTASTAANATPATPNQLWIAGTHSLTVFDANGQLLGSVLISGGPQNISIPGGFTAYVTTRQGTIVAVDLNTRQVIRTLLSGGQFGPMDYDANTGEIYVPDRQHNQLDILTPITASAAMFPKEPTRIFHLGSSPQSIAITSDGQLGFVALSNGQVSMLDIPGRSIIANVAVGGTPQFIITGLYPPANSTPSLSRQTIPGSQAKPFNFPLLIALMVLIAILLLYGLWLLKRVYQKRH